MTFQIPPNLTKLLSFPTSHSYNNFCWLCHTPFGVGLKFKHHLLTATPRLFEFSCHLQSLRSPSTIPFVDRNETVCGPCHKSLLKSLNEGGMPRRMQREIEMNQQSDRVAQQNVWKEEDRMAKMDFPSGFIYNQDHPIPFLPPPPPPPPFFFESIPQSEQPPKLAFYTHTNSASSRNAMSSLLPPDTAISIGNVGRASLDAVRNHIPPEACSHIFSSVRVSQLAPNLKQNQARPAPPNVFNISADCVPPIYPCISTLELQSPDLLDYSSNFSLDQNPNIYDTFSYTF